MALDPILALEVKSMSRMRSLREAEKKGDSEIRKSFHNAVVFVTGGSGFLGKQLLDKLFRACSDIKKIYLLSRSKKGKSMHERLEEQLKDPVYDELWRVYPGFEQRITPVEGNMSELRLGLKQSDWQTLTKEVNFIFHVAATVRFDEPLKSAILTNVRGTRELVQLAQECPKLRSMVHVSTAYAHCNLRSELKEVFYDSPMSPGTIIELVETLDDKKLSALEPILTEGWPNTYTFSKAIAEETIRVKGQGLPVCIIRPGIVTAAYYEPSPGWLDVSNCYGPSGIILGSGLGVIHTFLGDKNNKVDVVPVDYTNNLTIAAAWDTVQRHGSGETDKKIYTLARKRNPIDLGIMQTWLETEGRNFISPMAIWYSYAITTSNNFLFRILNLFLHRIPAFFVDGVLMLLGKEIRLGKVYEKSYKMNSLLSYFLLWSWTQHDENTVSLIHKLSGADKEIFSFDMAEVDPTEYMNHWCLGLRKFILKDGLRDTDYAKKKQRWLKVANAVVIVFYAILLWKVFWYSYLMLSFGFGCIF